MRLNAPSRLVVTTLLGLLLVAPAHAEDNPAQAYAAAADALPEPAAKYAMSWDGELLMGGNPMGTFQFKAEPAKGPDDELGWTVTDAMEFGNGSFVRNGVATLDRRMNPLRGRVTGKEQGTDSFEIWWERTATGFKIKRTWTKGGETKTEEKTVPHEGRAMIGFTALWIFSKMTLPTKASYAVTVFEPDPGPGDAMLEEAVWTAGGEGDWKGTQALTVLAKKGSKDLHGFFHPQTKKLLGVKTADPAKNMAFEIRPKSAAKPPADDVFGRAAKTAKEAASQAMLAFASGDLELLAKVVHWPTLHDLARKAYDEKHLGNPAAEPFLTVEEYQAAALQEFAGSLPKNPRQMMATMIKASQGALKVEEQDDGTAVVTFPPMFKSMRLRVGEMDGAWYLIRFPASPK